MDALKTYLKSLSEEERTTFASRCSTSLGYLRKAISINQRLGESLAINIERESGGLVKCETLRPDVDWGYLRNSCPQTKPIQEQP